MFYFKHPFAGNKFSILGQSDKDPSVFFCKESNFDWMAFSQFETFDPLRASIYVVGFEFEKLWWNNAWRCLLIPGVNFSSNVFMSLLHFLMTLCVCLGFCLKWLLSRDVNIQSIDWISLWSSLLFNLETSSMILIFGLSKWLLGDEIIKINQWFNWIYWCNMTRWWVHGLNWNTDWTYKIRRVCETFEKILIQKEVMHLVD